MSASTDIETIPAPTCPVCGCSGTLLYRDLEDQLFGAPGVWTVRICNTGCDVLWLDPVPKDLQRAYQFYHTHFEPVARTASPGRADFVRAIYRPIKNGYLRARFGYRTGIGPSWYQVFAPLAFLHPAGTDAIAGDAMFLSAPQPGLRLLDIGCGQGDLLEKMQQRGWRVEGVEFDPDCAARVEARGLKCYSRDLRELALPNETFDAIFMGHVIEHLFDPRGLLEECWRVLRASGRLVMVTPNAQSWGHKRYGRDWRGLESPRHLQIFSPRSLVRLTDECGFGDVTVRTTNRSAWYAIGMSAAMHRARARNSSHDATMLSIVSLRALYYEIFGRLLNLFQRDAGEEIILSARKH